MANLYGSSVPPNTGSVAAPKSIQHRFTVSAGTTLNSIRLYTPTGATAIALDFRLYALPFSGATAVATGTATLNTAVGWHEYPFTTPYTLATGTTYTIAFGTATGTLPYVYDTTANLPVTSGIFTFSGSGVNNLTGGDHMECITTVADADNYKIDFDFGSSALDVTVGSDQSIYTTQSASIAAFATGGSGTKTYAWTKTSGPTGTFSSAATSTGTFTPTGGAGVYVLRCTVTDGSGTDFDELTVTVTTVPSTTSYTTITSSTGWVATGGTVQAVLADGSDATYVTSPNSPSSAQVDGVLGAVTPPSPGQDFVVNLRLQKISATSGSLVCRLYDGATLISTVNVSSIPDTLSNVPVTFPAAEIAAMPSGTWAIGARLTISATAA